MPMIELVRVKFGAIMSRYLMNLNAHDQTRPMFDYQELSCQV